MTIVTIMAVVAFGIVLSIVEIPGMLASKSYKELWVFSILLLAGVVLAILKSLKITIPNPSDLIAWVYSPVSSLLEEFFK